MFTLQEQCIFLPAHVEKKIQYNLINLDIKKIWHFPPVALGLAAAPLCPLRRGGKLACSNCHCHSPPCTATLCAAAAPGPATAPV